MPYSKAFSTIIVPTGLALLLCNMDRIVMSVAILPIAKEFSWAPSTQVSPLPILLMHKWNAAAAYSASLSSVSREDYECVEASVPPRSS